MSQIFCSSRDYSRLANGTSGDLELSGLEVFSDGRGNQGLWSLSEPGALVQGEVPKPKGS